MATFVRTQQISHRIGASGRVEIGVRSADVQCRAVEGDEVRARATFEIRAASDEEADRIFAGTQLQVQRSAERVRIDETRTHRSGSGLAGALGRLLGDAEGYSLDLELELPARAELRLETVSGDVQASGLRGKQQYHTVSGDLYLTALGGDVRVNSVSGDATLRGEDTLQVRAEAVSGDLSIAAPVLRGIRASTVSGDIDLDGELRSDGNFWVETVSGDLLVGLLGGARFEVRGLSTDISSSLDHRIEGSQDRRRVLVGSGGPTFVFHSMSGDLSIGRARRVEAPGRSVGEPAAASDAAPSGTGDDASRIEILHALERGEIDVDEAMRRIAAGGDDG